MVQLGENKKKDQMRLPTTSHGWGNYHMRASKPEDHTPTGSDHQPWQKKDFEHNTDDKWEIITGTED